MSTRVEIKDKLDDNGTTLYSPVYYYEVNGKEYSCSSKTYNSIKPSSENKKVKYDSNNPSNCVSAYFITGIKLLNILLVPLSFIIFTIIEITIINKRVKKIETLNTYGKLIKKLSYRIEKNR